MSTSKMRQFLSGGLMLVGLALVSLITGLGSPVQAASGATFTVLAGGMSMAGGIEMVAFAPQTLKVHRGDTVQWKFGAIHNMRFATAAVTNLVKMGVIDGMAAGQIDPTVAVANIKSGAAFIPNASAGILGLPVSDNTFSLVMDTAPGTYTYLCDIHPGMIGFIQVVDDTTDVPTPAQVETDEQAQLRTAISDGQKTYVDLADKAMPQSTSDTLDIIAGGSQGTTVIHRFFPTVGVIHAGQNVTWTVPPGLITATVNFGPLKDGVPLWVKPLKDKAGALHFVGNIDLMPNSNNGEEVAVDSASGLLLPGQHFTLHFSKPGIYQYYSAVHDGQLGTIIVLPADQS